MATSNARRSFKNAKLIIFDFDGVIVDSNGAKLDCFLEMVAPFGVEATVLLRKFLSKRPNATRFEVVDSIVQSGKVGDSITEDALLSSFSECSKSKVLELQVTPALRALREADTRMWALVSATEHHDIKEIAFRLGIANFFQAGIFGTPMTKVEHIRALCDSQGLRGAEVILFGDRISDLQAAIEAGIGFVFVSDWSDAHDNDLEVLKDFPSIESLSNLLVS